MPSPPESPAREARPPRSPTPESLREWFPGLEIVELLGAGGMGAVYKARQPRLNRFVALKILTCPPEWYEDFALRFEREAQVMARLSHPHIVTIHDFGEIDRSEAGLETLFYFVMEYVDGADLCHLIRSGELRSDQALSLVPQICDALQFAHDEGITHRDIKPANILVDKRGVVKIADFGLAKLIQGDETLALGLTMTGTAMGTPHYMAPEQWETPDRVDHRADIYSLGVVFYEMLTGTRPAGVFEPPSKKSPVDGRIDTVVMRAMEREPDRRYQQAREVGDEVTRVVKEGQAGPRIRSRPSPWVAATGVALLAGTAGLLSMRPSGEPVEIEAETPKSVAEAVVESPGPMPLGNSSKPAAEPAPKGASSTPSVAAGAVPTGEENAGTNELKAFPPGRWVKVFANQAEIDAIPGLKGKLVFRDGWVDCSGPEITPTLRIPGTTWEDSGLRLRGKLAGNLRGNLSLTITFRLTSLSAQSLLGYRLLLHGLEGDKPSASVALYDIESKKSTFLSQLALDPPIRLGDEYEAEFYVIGDRLIGRINGQAVPLARDARLKSGQMAVQTPHWFRDVEVINLTGLPEAEALKWAGEGPTSGAEATAGSEPVAGQFRAGRLRALGTTSAGTAPDLSKVATFDDLVEVGGSGAEWVVLRQNGETVSAKGDADFSRIARIAWSFGHHVALITWEGRILFPGNRQRDLPPRFEGAKIVDAKLGNDHGIALTAEGRALVFGKRYLEAVGDPADAVGYGSPRWPEPPAAALSGVKAIAVTQTHAATLKSDGTLTVFGWNGVVTLPQTKGLEKIEAIGSGEDYLCLLDANGGVWRFPLPRNPSPNQPVWDGGKAVIPFAIVAGAPEFRGLCWRDAGGVWRHPIKAVEEMLLAAGVVEDTAFVTSEGLFGGKAYHAVLWIEPKEKASPQALGVPKPRGFESLRFASADRKAALARLSEAVGSDRLGCVSLAAFSNPFVPEQSRPEGIQLTFQAKGWASPIAPPVGSLRVQRLGQWCRPIREGGGRCCRNPFTISGQLIAKVPQS